MEEIDMTLGTLSQQNLVIPKDHKIWIMGNSKGITQKRCLIEGKEGYNHLKDHVILGQINVQYENEVLKSNDVEQTPFATTINDLIPRHILLGNNVLWRYMELFKFKDIIENKHLHYSRLDQFSDYLEGQSSFTCKKAIAKTPTFSKEQKLKNIKFFNARMKSNRINSFACCWHINNSINFEMWKEYGNNTNNSLCIKTSVYRLEKELKKTNIPFINEPVQYFDEPFFNQNAYWYPSLFKRQSYKNEAEFRSIFFVNGLDLKFGKIKINPENLISKIYIHPDASKDFIKEIKALLKTNNLSIPVQISKNTF